MENIQKAITCHCEESGHHCLLNSTQVNRVMVENVFVVCDIWDKKNNVPT